jgi:ribonuclease HI
MTYIVYTDGGCSPNPGNGGWSAIIVNPNGKEIEIFGAEKETTNNRMELTAAIRALSAIPQGANVHIYSDSRYLVEGITNWIRGWRRKNFQRRDHTGRIQQIPNHDLWRELDKLIMIYEIVWYWVRGHGDNAMNNRCDALATKARLSLVEENDPAR